MQGEIFASKIKPPPPRVFDRCPFNGGDSAVVYQLFIVPPIVYGGCVRSLFAMQYCVSFLVLHGVAQPVLD